MELSLLSFPGPSSTLPGPPCPLQIELTLSRPHPVACSSSPTDGADAARPADQVPAALHHRHPAVHRQPVSGFEFRMFRGSMFLCTWLLLVARARLTGYEACCWHLLHSTCVPFSTLLCRRNDFNERARPVKGLEWDGGSISTAGVLLGAFELCTSFCWAALQWCLGCALGWLCLVCCQHHSAVWVGVLLTPQPISLHVCRCRRSVDGRAAAGRAQGGGAGGRRCECQPHPGAA